MIYYRHIKRTTCRKAALDRGQTGRISLTGHLDLQSPASYGHDLLPVRQKFKVNGQLVPKIEWKQTDGQTDGGDCITSLANAVGNNE